MVSLLGPPCCSAIVRGQSQSRPRSGSLEGRRGRREREKAALGSPACSHLPAETCRSPRPTPGSLGAVRPTSQSRVSLKIGLHSEMAPFSCSRKPSLEKLECAPSGHFPELWCPLQLPAQAPVSWASEELSPRCPPVTTVPGRSAARHSATPGAPPGCSPPWPSPPGSPWSGS